MGGCLSGLKPETNELPNVTKLSKLELELLELMYNDLACRTRGKNLSREIFDIFFHVSGLWGQEMFRRFDKNKDGTISFTDFVTSVEIVVKGSFEQKANILFDYYDVEHNQRITYRELVKMLSSYPKEELNKMVTDGGFLSSISSFELSFYFNKNKTLLDDQPVIEEVSEDSEPEVERERRPSVFQPSSEEMIRIQSEIGKTIEESAQKKKTNVPVIVQKRSQERLQKKQEKYRESSKFKGLQQMRSLPSLDQEHKNVVLMSNITSIIKKYAVYLFKEQKADVETGFLSRKQFIQLIRGHSCIFDTFVQGFHTYVWQVDEDKIALSKKQKVWIESECFEVVGEVRNKRYLVFLRTTMFVYPRMSAVKPVAIRNMEGLMVRESNKDEEYGIIVRHKDGLYPPATYVFASHQIQKQWLSYLDEFLDSSIYDEFTFQEKIGTGNFSSVYKGINKEDNETVAIKVIEKFRFEAKEINVIKEECSILRLCHHQNIVKFYKKYDTKTHIYIITELFSQGDLFEYTKKTDFLEEYEAAGIFKQLVDAIGYLNQSVGIIHRDLKPQNIMLANKERSSVPKVKLIDFGFAIFKDNLVNLPEKEKFAGTPGFVAPEMLLRESYDEAVDVFSLGIILYFMLCGAYPFFSNYVEEIVEQTRNCNINLSSSHWNNISQQAKSLIYSILTFKDQRIKLNQVAQHPFLTDIEVLKDYHGRNRRRKDKKTYC